MGDDVFKIKEGFAPLFKALVNRYGPDRGSSYDSYLVETNQSLERWDMCGMYISLALGCAVAMSFDDLSNFFDIVDQEGIITATFKGGINGLVATTYNVYGEMLDRDDQVEGLLAARREIYGAILGGMLSSLLSIMAAKLEEGYMEGGIDDGVMGAALNDIRALAAIARIEALDKYNEENRQKTQELYDALVGRKESDLPEELLTKLGMVSEHAAEIYRFLRPWSFIFTQTNMGVLSESTILQTVNVLVNLGIPRDFLVRAVHSENVFGDDDDDDEPRTMEDGLSEHEHRVWKDHEVHVEKLVTGQADEMRDTMVNAGGIDVSDLLRQIQEKLDNEDES